MSRITKGPRYIFRLLTSDRPPTESTLYALIITPNRQIYALGTCTVGACALGNLTHRHTDSRQSQGLVTRRSLSVANLPRYYRPFSIQSTKKMTKPHAKRKFTLATATGTQGSPASSIEHPTYVHQC